MSTPADSIRSYKQDKPPLWQAMDNELRDMPKNARVKDGMHFTRLCCAAEIRALAVQQGEA